MKRRILLVLSILGIALYPHISLAQWEDPMVNDTAGGKHTAGIYGMADICSNSITNLFAVNFALGNYLDNNLKDGVSSRLQNDNRLGYILNYGAYVVWHNDTIQKKRVFNFFFALRHKSYINVDFSPDVFKVAFYGNAMYAGKNANFSGFSFNSLSYQQAEVGLVCTNFGGHAQLGIGLSFLAGQKLLTIDAPSASLYTEQTGQYLLFNSNAQLHESDTSATQQPINGFGASVDLFFKAPYKIGKKTGTISVSVSDLGFMYWNNKSISYQKDTSYDYSGITINSITDLQNAAFNSLKKDSLQNKYLPFQKETYYSPLPATLSINSNTNMGKWHLEAGFMYMFNANNLGYIYAQYDKPFSKGWMWALQLGYGGYETINSAFTLTKQIKKAELKLVINHLQGFVLPNYFGGAGIYAEYSHSF
ncbi:MAG TPA: DUF5723 family protein [Bacteroidia bacterium]|nr:DUF5723 family protein [Bacteroidia bacterium]